MQITVDYTFLIQLGMFGVLLVVLSRLLFAPFLQVLAERDARTTGDVEEAAATRAEVASLSARVDADLARSRTEAKAEVDALRARTREEASQLFENAQHEASARLAELRDQVASATREARSALSADARTMADAMVAAVIGRGGNA